MADNEFAGIVIPAHIVEYATQQAKAARAAEGKSTNSLNANKIAVAFVEKLLAECVPANGLQVAHPVAPAPVIDSVEQAAEVIVASLEPEHQHKLRQVSKETNHPLAAYVISPILLANDNGAYSTLLGRWADSVPEKQVVKSSSTSICEFCHQPIVKPHREGQRFCNMPEDGSDSCGSKWNRLNVMPLREKSAVERAYGPQTPVSV